MQLHKVTILTAQVFSSVCSEGESFFFNVSDDGGSFRRTKLRSEVWPGVIQTVPALLPWRPGLLWGCVVENKKMVDFFQRQEKWILQFTFNFNARKELQRMEIICCSRPELRKDKFLARMFLRLQRRTFSFGESCLAAFWHNSHDHGFCLSILNVQWPNLLYVSLQWSLMYVVASSLLVSLARACLLLLGAVWQTHTRPAWVGLALKSIAGIVMSLENMGEESTARFVIAATARNPHEDTFILAQVLYSILRADLGCTYKAV